jgi:prephenate dehydrogenase
VDVAVLGLGLIGGSLLQALAAAGHRVTGYDADPHSRDQARAGGWTVAGSVAAAVAGTELVVVAVPLPVLSLIFEQLADHDGLITDVTSVKRPALELAGRHGLRRFVGGHPMAGKETSGFAAAEPGLFAGCAWVLGLEPGREARTTGSEPISAGPEPTHAGPEPTDAGPEPTHAGPEPTHADPGRAATAVADWLRLAALFTSLGARVVPATAAEHDRAVAQVSHVPHLFAAVLAEQVPASPLAGTLAAGSFRDGTRVAATRPELIAAMCGGNAGEVGDALGRLIGELEQLRAVLAAADPVGRLTGRLAPASEARRHWPAVPGEPIELPAGVAELLDLGRAGGWVTAVDEAGARVTAVQPRLKRPGTDRNRS